MRVNSQLEKAQLENLTADPSAGTKGRVWHNTTSGLTKFDDGSAVRTVATIDNTQTLTNKTINAIGNGNANEVLYLDGSKNLATESALAISRGGTSFSTFTTGNILYASATDTLSKLAIGSAGQVLTVSAGVPSWQSPASTDSFAAKTANYTLTSSDGVIAADASGGGFTLTLPAASSVSGKIYRIIRTDGTYANTVTIARSGSDTFQRQGTTDTSLTLNTVDEAWELQSDGTSKWYVLNHRTTSSNIGLGTLTINGLTLTNATHSAYRRGNMLKILAYAQITGTAASVAYLSLPSGIALDQNHLSSVANAQTVGIFIRYPDAQTDLAGTSTGPYMMFTDATSNSSKIYLGTQISGSHFTFNQKNGSTIFNATNEAISIECEFPVFGWLG